MNLNKLHFTLILALLLVTVCAAAQNLKTASIFCDHAVLQRESTVPVWGWADAGKTVSVKCSWNGKMVKTTVADDGSWRVNVATGEAGGPYTITVKCGKDKAVLSDIMLGEVWICTGQSNMEMPVSGFGFQEVEGGTEAIMEAFESAKDIRVFNIKTPKCFTPIADVEATWQYSTGEVAAWTSAIGYFFAKRLQRSLDVPVGIIVNAWGGSRIEPWMTKESIDNAGISPAERAEIDALVEDAPWPRIPEVIWNGRMAPIAGYGARGFLWYQGCSNIGQDCYDKLQTAMLKLWREQWGRGDMPFIYVLLAPYDHGDRNGRWRPHFVETQLRAQELSSNCWAVCTETLGNEVTIHPPKKREVADMMVLRALQNVYGMSTGVSMELPRLKEVKYEEDGSVKIKLTEVWSNLGSISGRQVVGFELAGEDRAFHLADAEIDWDGETIIVRCASVPHPVAVRYAYRNYMGANLQKSNGIPVPPFRTDDWDY